MSSGDRAADFLERLRLKQDSDAEKFAGFAAEFREQTRVMQFSAGQTLALEQDECKYLPLVLAGQVRVFKAAETGREITLYRIAPFESCVLTASCILDARHFPAQAIVEHSAEVLLVPAAVFERWMDRYPWWRRYVFGILANRLDGVIATVSEVAFARIDARLAERLLELGGPADADPAPVTLYVTHQQLANELGTAREVVSRTLKDFEHRGWIRLSRNEIKILFESRAALRSLNA